MPDQTIRETPRISLNKLGEYLIATPRQRRRILQKQKRPPQIPVIYYDPATVAIAQFFDAGANDDQVVLDAIEQLSEKIPTSDFDYHRTENCILALEGFLDTLDVLSTDADGFESVRGESALFSVAGVDVSIRPEVLLRDESGRVIGGYKLYFSKHEALHDRPGRLIATMLYLFMKEEYGESIEKGECCILDVFDASVISAPRSHKRRRQDLQAACQEIAALWDGI